MSEANSSKPIYVCSAEQLRLEKRFGKAAVGRDGDCEIRGYEYAGTFYVTQEIFSLAKAKSMARAR
jgi:hypothetical protein